VCSQFTAIRLEYNQIALYCIAIKLLLAMSCNQVIGVSSGRRLHGTSDEDFIYAIPHEAKFVFNSNSTDDSTITLFSTHCHRYIRMTPYGSVDGDAKQPRQWETYEIILLMKMDD
jgi:hypothetical protein